MLNFIYNPCAGSGKSQKYYDIISKELKNSGIEHAFFETKGKSHATKIANELTSNGNSDIIVMGGDGTLHEVLNGLSNPANVNLGLIPCGSGNDFAASANIPSSPLDALGVILSGNTKYVDFMDCSGVRGISALARSFASEILLYSFICITFASLTDTPDSHSSAADSFLLLFFRRFLTAREVLRYGILKISSAIKVSPIDKSVKNIILKII